MWHLLLRFVHLFINLSHSLTKPKNDYEPSEESDQPGHWPSLIRAFAVRSWVVKDPMFLHADSEDSDQTGWMLRLIWVFAGCTGHFVGFVMLWLISFIVMILSIQTDRPGQTALTQIRLLRSSLIRVYTAIPSASFEHIMLKPHSSNFRIITAFFLDVLIF